jgi:23S rRNA-/tRNA-specific pseudouridylate synthase
VRCCCRIRHTSKPVIPGPEKHSTGKHLPRGLEILYEDRDILVVDKPAGLLTVGTETNKFKTAHYILTDYVRKGSLKSRNRIFTVHRLD